MTKKRPGPTQGVRLKRAVRLIEVSVKKELTVNVNNTTCADLRANLISTKLNASHIASQHECRQVLA